MHLPPHQYALLAALAATDDPAPSIEALATASGADQAQLTAAAVELEREGLLRIEEQAYTEAELQPFGALALDLDGIEEIELGEAGEQLAKGAEAIIPGSEGTHVMPPGSAWFAERWLVRTIRWESSTGCMSVKSLASTTNVQLMNIAPANYVRSLQDDGWITFDKGILCLTEMARHGEPPLSDLEYTLLELRRQGGKLEIESVQDQRIVRTLRNPIFKGRKDLFRTKPRARRLLSFTETGTALRDAFRRGEVAELREVNELTPEMLADGSWRQASFRAYDVTLAAERVVPGKPHPMSRLTDEVRRAFLALGFEEANCPMAESAFWDFDALFQPQDHPAREMQDTLYCSNPARYELPDSRLVEAVRATHETGGDTGSLGWRYKWSAERASQVVLRTHMTACSILALAADPRPPRKVFSIGRVFRRETLDATHLPEFTQVDGIIIDEHANLASLLGTLTTFYSRMGIDDIKMKPAFFPYTEPSVEVHVKWAGRWMEMGGAGIFRPEVTEPFGCRVPVLAWGLGLERLAMARFGLSSIKELYQSRLDWLRSVPLNS